jgi:ubiquinone/menaquinone biosynthesis C-methylase UbiE
MWRAAQARKKAQEWGIKLELYVMDTETLEFPDASFDTVASALSTCTFPDPVAALRELGRVCHPEGRILLFEHGRSSWTWVGRWMDRRAAEHFESLGYRWNQEPIELVKEAGLKIISARRARLGGVFSMIEAAGQ